LFQLMVHLCIQVLSYQHESYLVSKNNLQVTAGGLARTGIDSHSRSESKYFNTYGYPPSVEIVLTNSPNYPMLCHTLMPEQTDFIELTLRFRSTDFSWWEAGGYDGEEWRRLYPEPTYADDIRGYFFIEGRMSMMTKYPR
jgi:hypothetical protein